MAATDTKAERCAPCWQKSNAPSPLNASGKRPEIEAEDNPADLVLSCQLIDNNAEIVIGVPGCSSNSFRSLCCRPFSLRGKRECCLIS